MKNLSFLPMIFLALAASNSSAQDKEISLQNLNDELSFINALGPPERTEQGFLPAPNSHRGEQIGSTLFYDGLTVFFHYDQIATIEITDPKYSLIPEKTVGTTTNFPNKERHVNFGDCQYTESIKSGVITKLRLICPI
ncbi:hypothetical protein KFE80_12275 [bacterium SCSIO 12696]|nr:hypothetical protein KFE80_12275 [bacterium SCSIO 12696]